MALPEDDVEEIEPEPRPGPDPRPRARRPRRRARAAAGPRHGRARPPAPRRSSGETDAAPIVLDAEALRSLATLDGWWEGDRRPAVLTPHAGEFARLRAGSGGAAGDDGDLVGDDDARLAAARRRRRDLGPGRRPQGRPDGHRRPRTAASPSPRSRTRPSPRGGTGDVLSGTIGVAARPGPRAVRRGAARASTSTAWPATRSASGSATPGLLASDLPDGLAIARKRLAALAERRSRSKRLGFAAREAPAEPVADAARAPGDPADGPSHRADGPGTPPDRGSAWPRPGCRRCRGRPGSRSTSTRCAPTSRSLRAPGRPGRRRSGRSSRPMPTGTARSRSPRALEAPAPTASASPRSTRPSSCARAASRGPILVLYPIPPALGRRRRPGAGIAVTAGDAARPRRELVGRAAAGVERPLAVELEVETGLGRGGFAVEEVVAAAARSWRTRRASRWAGCGPTSRRPRTRRSRPRQVARFEAAVAALGAAGIALPPRHAAASAGILAGTVRGLRRRPARAGDLRAASPTSCDAATRAGRGGRPAPPGRCRCTPGRSGSPTCRPGPGISYGPTFRTARPSRIATLPVGYGDGWPRSLSEPGRARSSAACACRSSATWRWTRSWPTSPTSRAAGRRRRRVRPARRRRATSGSRPRELARSAPRTRGRSSPAWPAGYPGCTMRRPDRSVCGRSPSGEAEVARIELWNGDICDLEVDAIVNAAEPVAVDVDRRRRRDQARRRRRDRVRRRPPGARPARRRDRDPGRHAGGPVRSSTPCRSTATGGRAARSSRRPSAARWPGPARSARRASPSRRSAPASAASRSTRRRASPSRRPRRARRQPRRSTHVIFALRGAAAYQAFSAALARAPEPIVGGRGMSTPFEADRGAARRARRAGRPRDPAARPDRSGRPLPRGQPPVPPARRERDALLRPGPARRVRRRPRVGQRDPRRRRRDRAADRPARGDRRRDRPGTPDRALGRPTPAGAAAG